MIQIRRSAIVRHSPSQMFDLVNDVEAYPRRFAWCAGAQVSARDANSLTARLDLRLGGLTQSFTTRNALEPPQRILMQLVEGPFRALNGEWNFMALRAKPPSSGPSDHLLPQAGEGEFERPSVAASPKGCKIAFALDFDYSGLMGPVLRAGFQKLADRMVDEFCREADRIYV
ncbi:MAG TPA: type II toxin-antitoxin system RatA family toxin [Rudaea sp.]|jgi:ribosome-associated toxin RatA of RatAB toxin-antitoxin module|uniref:type II toxin-antitoxin system RatA family toxin n=1 Tax=Rudaea sp. TaxID=2136325 RepID=UPI002F93CEB2